MPGQLMNMGNWFFFLSLSNFWIIFLHIISIWINEWFARIYLIEESKVTLVAPGNYEIKFKSAHITAPSSSSRIVFSVFSRLRESWGTAQGEERLLDTEESSSPLTWAPSSFRGDLPFLVMPTVGKTTWLMETLSVFTLAQPQPAPWECSMPGSSESLSQHFSLVEHPQWHPGEGVHHWNPSQTPLCPSLMEPPECLWLLSDCGTYTSLTQELSGWFINMTTWQLSRAYAQPQLWHLWDSCDIAGFQLCAGFWHNSCLAAVSNHCMFLILLRVLRTYPRSHR